MLKRTDSLDHPNVMVSSTYTDLVEHRRAVIDALVRLGFFPVGMEFDSSKAGKDVVESSIGMVDKAHAYVGLLSHRYGGVPKDSSRNPEDLSVTEIEYRRALDRGIPVYMFLMSDHHPVTKRDVESVEAHQVRLQALKDDARSRSISVEFSSVEELKGLVLQSLAELRAKLSQAVNEDTADVGERSRGRASEIPLPPDLLAIPTFISGHEFLGRRTELGWLDQWAVGTEPLMVLGAIGGTGKSTLAWQWLQERARAVRPDLAGAIWYSFYEGGADMAAFAAHALAYATERPLDELRGMKTSELAPLLLARLRERPFLLVLDGLERVLVAYHRLDAAQVRDDQVSSDSDHRECTKPADADLLRNLVAAFPSKVLVTSRLLPSALTNRAGRPLPGVLHRQLSGMHPDDALAMMTRLGVRGDTHAIRRYLTESFDNHPLLLGIVAGLVNDYFRDPGNFDRWADDPQGGAAIDLAKLDLSQRRTHILAAALNGLEPGERQLLSRLAALADAVPFETVEALNPFMPTAPEEPPAGPSEQMLLHLLGRTGDTSTQDGIRSALEKQRASAARYASDMEAYNSSEDFRQALPKLISALQDLERRGLLQWDRQKNVYDLHPVVRGYAFDILETADRTDICNRIADHFQRKPSDRFGDARTIADVQQSINLFRALTQAGRFEEAVQFYKGDLSHTILFSIEALPEALAMLRSLFPHGIETPADAKHSKSYDYLRNDLAIVLYRLGRFSEARDLYCKSLHYNLQEDDAYSVFIELINLGLSLMDDGRIELSFRVLELALLTADSVWFKDGLARVNLDLARHYRMRGLIDSAESAYNAFAQLPVPTNRAVYRPGMGEAEICWLRFQQGSLTAAMLDEAEAVADKGNNRVVMRGLCELRGELLLQRGEPELAAEAYARAIELTRTAGIRVDRLEARLAIARVRAGDRDQAKEICDRLHDNPRVPHVEIAAAYLEIGDDERAREHALAGYGWAWADGPPYTLHFELEECRAVLASVGEPEPRLPQFDLEKVEPLPYEKEIRDLITRKKEEKIADENYDFGYHEDEDFQDDEEK